MALKGIVEKLDEVPEEARGFYQEKDGRFILAVEGMVPKDRLDAFRENNIQLKKAHDELMARFDGIDPDEARKLTEKAAKERDKKLIDSGKVEELLNERVAAVKSAHEKEIKAFAAQVQATNAEKSRLVSQLEGLVIDGAIRDAAVNAGVKKHAIGDVLRRGREIFRLQDGKAVPMEGDRMIYGKSGDPMEIAEWMSGLVEQADFLFERSTGSGARASERGGAGGNKLARDDNSGFLDNLAKIAAGKVQVA